MVDTPTKTVRNSKTIIANVLTVVIAAATAVYGTDVIAAHPQWAAAITAGVGVLNIALRFLTTQPIESL